MTSHRELQRTLLRMQLDASFAAKMLAGEPAAVASTRLKAADLELLRAADPRAIAADANDARRWQVLGNVAREFALSTGWAKVALPKAQLLESFASSPELHAALANEGRLPLAFAEYATRRAKELGDAFLTALTRLESAMAKARRLPREGFVEPAPGELVLAPAAHLVELPTGALAHADEVRTSLDTEGAHLPPPPRLPDTTETILILARPAPSRYALPELHVERLEPAVTTLLAATRTPIDGTTRARLAESLGAAPTDLEDFADGLVTDGGLLRG